MQLTVLPHVAMARTPIVVMLKYAPWKCKPEFPLTYRSNAHKPRRPQGQRGQPFLSFYFFGAATGTPCAQSGQAFGSQCTTFVWSTA